MLKTIRRIDARIAAISFPADGCRLVAIKQALRGLFWRVIFSRRLVKIFPQRTEMKLGPWGERVAERFLLRQGMIILFRSYRDRLGEIDLIAVDQRTIVFVEVKTRATDIAGQPEDAVDEPKQTRLTKTAVGFLKWHRLTEYAARFDVIAIRVASDSDSGSASEEIRHYKNAFEPVGEFQFFS